MLTVALIGAGVAGRGFAAVCAAAGFAVTLEDVMPAKLRQADEELAEFKGLVRLVMTVEDAVRDADVVVDFVPDELESKLEIWSMIDRMAPPKTVMCTPSDALSITDLASCTYRGDRCVMVRGLGSASVRLLRAAETSDGAIQVVAALFSGLGVEWSAEADPDLPMLLKNMRAARIS